MDKKIIISPIPIWGGMAGNKRIRNLIVPLCDNYDVENIYIKSNSQISDQKTTKNISIFEIRSRNKLIQNFRLLQHILKRNKEKEVILYYYGSPFIFNIWIFPILRHFGVKVIFDIVEDYSLFSNHKNFLQKFNYKISEGLFKQIKHYSNGIVCISNYLENKIFDLTKGKIPLLKLPISVNINDFGDNVNQKKGKLTFFYGGSFVYKDGVQDLIQVFDTLSKENKNIELKLSGKGIQEDMDRLNFQLKKLKNRRITYVGFVSDEQYLSYIKKSQILCVPRKNTPFALAGFPFKLGEYLATGNVVLASEIGSLSEVFNNDEVCFYNPDDLNDLKLKMSNLILNSNYRETIGVKGKAFAFEYFDSTEHSKKLIEFVLQL